MLILIVKSSQYSPNLRKTLSCNLPFDVRIHKSISCPQFVFYYFVFYNNNYKEEQIQYRVNFIS